jgi:multidrug efflux pump subunit AcrA (membrane-fusion protein)
MESSLTHVHLGEERLKAFKHIYRVDKKYRIKKWMVVVLLGIVIIMFLPWTQNIRAKGTITSLRQEYRVQEVNTVIAGRVLKWYVKEGDYVNAGDTLFRLGEVKVEYFDTSLINRTKDQIDAKQQSIEGYKSKAATSTTQMQALQQGRELKLQSLDNKLLQQQLKVVSDSTDLIAIQNELLIYKRQIDAARIMFDSGAISLIDFEKRKVNYQNAQAKRISGENKFLQDKQELIGLRIEKNSAIQDYTDKIAKADGEKFASLSNVASSEADVSKLQNTYSNYDARNNFYYILAPQSGQLTKIKKEGIGEMLKEGETVAEIVPTQYDYAVEMYIEPMNIPLIEIGQKVRLVFDGFPAIIFSGWPKDSYGTFGGKIVAVETSVGSNGKFRVLVAQDPEGRNWPKQLRLGSGAYGIALLKDVPVYYELWRNINGFPPEYYKQKDDKSKDKEKAEKDPFEYKKKK